MHNRFYPHCFASPYHHVVLVRFNLSKSSLLYQAVGLFGCASCKVDGKKKKKSTINDSLLSHAVGQLDLQSQ